jgi:hypothetical protein
VRDGRCEVAAPFREEHGDRHHAVQGEQSERPHEGEQQREQVDVRPAAGVGERGEREACPEVLEGLREAPLVEVAVGPGFRFDRGQFGSHERQLRNARESVRADADTAQVRRQLREVEENALTVGRTAEPHRAHEREVLAVEGASREGLVGQLDLAAALSCGLRARRAGLVRFAGSRLERVAEGAKRAQTILGGGGGRLRRAGSARRARQRRRGIRERRLRLRGRRFGGSRRVLTRREKVPPHHFEDLVRLSLLDLHLALRATGDAPIERAHRVVHRALPLVLRDRGGLLAQPARRAGALERHRRPRCLGGCREVFAERVARPDAGSVPFQDGPKLTQCTLHVRGRIPVARAPRERLVAGPVRSVEASVRVDLEVADQVRRLGQRRQR